MIEQRIREIANQASTYAEDTVDYYSGIVNGLTWEAKILKARDLKFAELVVLECAELMKKEREEYHSIGSDYCDHKAEAFEEAIDLVTKHFGVEE